MSNTVALEQWFSSLKIRRMSFIWTVFREIGESCSRVNNTLNFIRIILKKEIKIKGESRYTKHVEN